MKKFLLTIFPGLAVFSFCILISPDSGTGQDSNGYIGTKNCINCHPKQKKLYNQHVHSMKKEAGMEMLKDEKGIGCESCHGPGQAHVSIGAKELSKLKAKKGDFKITVNKKSELCGSCHNKTDKDKIVLVDDSLIASQQQYAELKHSVKVKKFKMTCGMCHEPHSTAKEQKGIKRKCLDCHKGKYKVDINIPAMAKLSCEDCHMPYAVKNAKATMIQGYNKGDTHSHIFGISVDPDYTLNDGTKHASITKDGLARLTVEMTCYACHKTGEASDKDRKELLKASKKIHKN